LIELVKKENTAEINSDYSTAMKFCEELLEVDVENIAKWSGKLQPYVLEKKL
jgi:hypothetical protein